MRLAAGELVDASKYTFRAITRIETAEPSLNWMNLGAFVASGGRQPAGVSFAVYLVE